MLAAASSFLLVSCAFAPSVWAIPAAAGVASMQGRPPLPTAAERAALPPDGGPRYNRLVFEPSPYLLQHATNPVDWYPWGEEAFARAVAEDKPIFLSIGYSTCHWCHVMEHESFEDAEVARLLNEHFVCVKVDREERPDVDHVYMAVTQALTGSGGWPNTLFLTPERKPFFAATYIPRASVNGRRGMLELIPFIGETWRTRRAELVADAESLAEHVRRFAASAPGPALGREALERAQADLAASFDAEHGGFGDAPKFPVPQNLFLLLHHHRRTGDARALAMVEETLRAMRRGGIYDHVGFGFHRYSTDAAWRVPHFEKMLYDQALISLAYVAAWLVTDAAEYRRTAEEVLAYVLRDLTSPEGAFYSAEDADSEGVEGRFYLWTPAELRAALGEEGARLFARAFDVSEEGNFRDEGTGARDGRSLPHLERPLSELAAELELAEAELAAHLEAARARLFAVREARVHPLKDDKVLSDWNGLMIAALARAGAAFDEPRYVAAAGRAADFVLTQLRDDQGRLLKRWRGGEAGLVAMLDDHAYLAWGLLELYEASFETRWLEEALKLVEAMAARFRDEEHGGFFLAPDDGERLFVRGKELYDGALPAGNSIAAAVLQRLARITARADLADLADGTLRAAAGAVHEAPAAHAQLLLAVDFALGPTFELVVAGALEAEDTRALLRAIRGEFLPNKVLLLRPPDEAGVAPPITRLAPYTAAQVAREAHGKRASAYVCEDFTCREPTSDPAVVLAALRARAPAEDE